MYASLQHVAPESKVRLSVSKVTETLTVLPSGLRTLATFVLTPDLTTPPDLLMTWLTERPHYP